MSDDDFDDIHSQIDRMLRESERKREALRKQTEGHALFNFQTWCRRLVDRCKSDNRHPNK